MGKPVAAALPAGAQELPPEHVEVRLIRGVRDIPHGELLQLARGIADEPGGKSVDQHDSCALIEHHHGRGAAIDRSLQDGGGDPGSSTFSGDETMERLERMAGEIDLT